MASVSGDRNVELKTFSNEPWDSKVDEYTILEPVTPGSRWTRTGDEGMTAHRLQFMRVLLVSSTPNRAIRD